MQHQLHGGTLARIEQMKRAPMKRKGSSRIRGSEHVRRPRLEGARAMLLLVPVWAVLCAVQGSEAHGAAARHVQKRKAGYVRHVHSPLQRIIEGDELHAWPVLLKPLGCSDVVRVRNGRAVL